MSNLFSLKARVGAAALAASLLLVPAARSWATVPPEHVVAVTGNLGSGKAERQIIGRRFPKLHSVVVADATGPGQLTRFGARLKATGPPWQSFALGEHWLGVRLDSSAAASSRTGAQVRWLAQTLKANPGRSVVAFMDTPRFGPGGNTGSRYLVNVLVHYRADVLYAAGSGGYHRTTGLDANGKVNRQRGMRHLSGSVLRLELAKGKWEVVQFTSDGRVAETHASAASV